VPVEMTRHVYLALQQVGDGLGLDGAGLHDAGYYALDALRIEAGRRAWGAELGPDESPFEAGLQAFVAFDKPVDFIGRAALLKARGEAPRKRLVSIVLDSPAPYVWGGEALSLAGQPVGELSSAGWSPRANACVGLGYLRGDAAHAVHAGTPIEVDLWGEAIAAKAWDHWPQRG